MIQSASSPGYRVMQIGARPLIAVPRAGKRVRACAALCYPAHTWKKTLLRRGLWFAVVCGLDRLLCRRVDWAAFAPGFQDVPGWLAKIEGELGAGPLAAAFVWPAQPDRGRLYVHVLDQKAERLAFAKLSLDEANDHSIGNELSALREIRAMKLERVTLPPIRSAGIWHGRQYGVFAPMPSAAQPIRWEHEELPVALLEEYAGETKVLQPAELEETPWFRRFWARSDIAAAFAADVRVCSGQGIEVCRVHGDLNRTNIFRLGGQFFLVDWEQSSDRGPRLTDAICIDVDRRWPQTQVNPEQSFRAFSEVYLAGASRQKAAAIVMALAFLHGAAFPPATKLVQHWNRLPSLRPAQPAATRG